MLKKKGKYYGRGRYHVKIEKEKQDNRRIKSGKGNTLKNEDN